MLRGDLDYNKSSVVPLACRKMRLYWTGTSPLDETVLTEDSYLCKYGIIKFPLHSKAAKAEQKSQLSPSSVMGPSLFTMYV